MSKLEIEISVEDYLKPLEAFAYGLVGELRLKCTQNKKSSIVISPNMPVKITEQKVTIL